MTVSGSKSILIDRPLRAPERSQPGKRESRWDEIKAEALAWVQEHNPECRALPRGVPGSPLSCPVALGLARDGEQWFAGARYIRNLAWRNGRRLTTPPAVSVFITSYDAGRYPELER